jgi:molybdopterin biosynthesis enzyme MoaB
MGKPKSYCAHRNHMNLAVGGTGPAPPDSTIQSIAIHQKRHEPYIDEKQIVILNVDEMRVCFGFWEGY